MAVIVPVFESGSETVMERLQEYEERNDRIKSWLMSRGGVLADPPPYPDRASITSMSPHPRHSTPDSEAYGNSLLHDSPTDCPLGDFCDIPSHTSFNPTTFPSAKSLSLLHECPLGDYCDIPSHTPSNSNPSPSHASTTSYSLSCTNPPSPLYPNEELPEVPPPIVVYPLYVPPSGIPIIIYPPYMPGIHDLAIQTVEYRPWSCGE